MRCRQRGAGLVEVAIALLVLAIGALGLGSLQITAKRMGHEAIQRVTQPREKSDTQRPGVVLAQNKNPQWDGQQQA